MLPFVFATMVAIVFPIIDGNTPHYYLPSLILWMFGLALFEIPSYILAIEFNKQGNVSYFKISKGKYEKRFNKKILCSDGEYGCCDITKKTFIL